jgi:hypothetical protein
MAKYVTGTREEWLAARLKLLKAEKEYSRQGDELTRQRQELPWVLVDKQYRFETDQGSASLKDLCRGRLAAPNISFHVRVRLDGGLSFVLDDCRRLQWLRYSLGQP